MWSPCLDNLNMSGNILPPRGMSVDQEIPDAQSQAVGVLNLTSGATIILTSGLAYVLSLAFRPLQRRLWSENSS